MNAIEILKINEDIIKQKYGVKRICILGSFAIREKKEGSDIYFQSGVKNGDIYP
jgi:predicted nucleotidyltransferase